MKYKTSILITAAFLLGMSVVAKAQMLGTSATPNLDTVVGIGGATSKVVQLGGLTVVGTATATYFIGNGAGLTNVTGTDVTRVLKAGDTMTGPLEVDANTAATPAIKIDQVGVANDVEGTGGGWHVTNNGLITSNGFTTTGNATATAFYGDGSHLTGVTAAPMILENSPLIFDYGTNTITLTGKEYAGLKYIESDTQFFSDTRGKGNAGMLSWSNDGLYPNCTTGTGAAILGCNYSTTASGPYGFNPSGVGGVSFSTIGYGIYGQLSNENATNSAAGFFITNAKGRHSAALTAESDVESTTASNSIFLINLAYSHGFMGDAQKAIEVTINNDDVSPPFVVSPWGSIWASGTTHIGEDIYATNYFGNGSNLTGISLQQALTTSGVATGSITLHSQTVATPPSIHYAGGFYYATSGGLTYGGNDYNCYWSGPPCIPVGWTGHYTMFLDGIGTKVGVGTPDADHYAEPQSLAALAGFDGTEDIDATLYSYVGGFYMVVYSGQSQTADVRDYTVAAGYTFVATCTAVFEHHGAGVDYTYSAANVASCGMSLWGGDGAGGQRTSTTGGKLTLGGNLTVSGDVTYSGAGSGIIYGGYYGDEIAWSQAAASQSVYYVVADSDLHSTATNGVTFQNNKELLISATGTYQINWSFNVSANAANIHIKSGIGVNDTMSAQGTNDVDNANNGDEIPVSGVTILQLNTGDRISIMTGTTDTGDPTLSSNHANLVVMMIGGK